MFQVWISLTHLCFVRKHAPFCRSFRKKDEPVTAEHLYRYYLDSRRTMRTVILPVFPKDFVSLKSGKGFHESCSEVYATAHRQEMAKINAKGVPKYTSDVLKTMQPPPLWEFSKLPWYLGLAVKIFRRNPQLAPNVGDVICDLANIPISRAAMKRKNQMEGHHPISFTGSNKRSTSYSTSVSHLSSIGKERRYKPTFFFVLPHFLPVSPLSFLLPSRFLVPTTMHTGEVDAATAHHSAAASVNAKKKLLWTKVLTAKSLAQNSNVTMRMAKTEELKNVMELLKEMRGVNRRVGLCCGGEEFVKLLPCMQIFREKCHKNRHH